MDHVLSPWQIFTNNGQFNSTLPPNQRNFQHRVTSSADIRDYHNTTPIHSYQIARDHSLSSMNNIKVDQRPNIRMNLHRSGDSRVRRTSSSFLKAKRLSNSVMESICSQRRQSLHLIENVPELTRECIICFLDQPINLFEEHYNNECEHFERTICDTCIYNHIKSSLENMINSVIFCPEPNCKTRFNFENIRYILRMGNNLELFERYDRQLTHEHLERIEEFVWCAHNGCGSGQLHDTGLYSNPMVTCIKCKKQTCAFHRIKWHIGITCEEYDQTKQISLDDNTQIWLKKHSKKCPKCQSYIEKISGCDHMTCKRCQYQFCWQCFADYRKIQIHGLTYHRKHCSHYPFYYRSNQISSTHRSTICNIL